jgi:2-polyprenyl-6-methoxyphenol hydroxylase-like FAD-dependent oxidoreductase
MAALGDIDRSLLDSATVFQTANGNERIYIMPYDSESVMWQLSFPMPEDEAKMLSAIGPRALKEEACRRTQWHDPVPQIVAATLEAQVSGYPVYDRALLKSELLENSGSLTLIGDAAHPMSPFKGQGANQALLDALSLARTITKSCRPLSKWREAGVRKSVLTVFETEMLARSAIKVKHSAEAAAFLHSDIVLHESDEPRGRVLQRKNNN